MNIVELILGRPSFATLDLTTDFDIALQYSLADIKDISKRNSAYSKTIVLPGTKNNNYWLGNLFDINSDFTNYNVNKKTDAYLVVNGEIVIDGFIQLRKVRKLVNVDSEGNEIQYEVVLFNNAVDLLTELGEKTLTDLDLGDYNHRYTVDAITQSWVHTWNDGYVYPMYGRVGENGPARATVNDYSVESFYPAVFHKKILDRIVDEAGYGWTGSLKTDQIYEREIIPYIGEGKLKISEEDLLLRTFRASDTIGTTEYYGPVVVRIGATQSSSGDPIPNPDNNKDFIVPNTQFALHNISATDNGLGVKFTFDDDFTPPNYDFDNVFGGLTPPYEFICKVRGEYQFGYNLDYILRFSNTGSYSTYVWGYGSTPITAFDWLNLDLSLNNDDRRNATVGFRIEHTLQIWRSGYTSPITSNNYVDLQTKTIYPGNGDINEKELELGLTQGYWLPNQNDINSKNNWLVPGLTPSQVFTYSVSDTHLYDPVILNVGDVVKLVIKVFRDTKTLDRGLNNATMFGLSSTNQSLIAISITQEINSTFYNFASGDRLYENDLINFNNLLSSKVKQKDIITDLIKRYNLYIEVDPDNPKMIIMNPKVNFYDNGQVLDWSHKKDYSYQDEIEFLSELQFKSLLLTYKEDNDSVNVDYTQNTGKIYGQKEIIFDNDFIKGEKRVETPFSPTPLIPTDFGAVVPAIDIYEPKGNARLLYWGGIKNLRDAAGNLSFNQWKLDYNIVQESPTFSSVRDSLFLNTYPYAGHFDDPFEPQIDINYELPDSLYYNNFNNTTNNNLYNRYWSDYINQIQEGKLLTTRLFLDETDIAYIKDHFNSRIFIDNAYYYVNRIKDYKPFTNEPVEVELIKIKDGLDFTPTVRSREINNNLAVCPPDIVIRSISNEDTYISQSGATVSQACCIALGGIYESSTGLCRVGTIGEPIGPSSFKIKSSTQFLSLLDRETNVGEGFVIGDNNTVGGESVSRGLLTKNYQITIGNNNSNLTNESIIIGDNNITTSNKSVILGADNNILSGEYSAVISGKNNTLAYGSIAIASNDNVVSAKNSIIINGFNNTIETDNTILINVSSLTQSVSNSAYLGDKFIVNTDIGRANLVDAQFEGNTKYFIGDLYTLENVNVATASIPNWAYLGYDPINKDWKEHTKAHLNYFDYTTNRVTEIPESDTWYVLGMTASVGFNNTSRLTVDDLGEVTYLGVTASIFKIEGVSSLSSENNNEVHLAFFKNGVLIPCSEQSGITTSGGKATSISFHCVTQLEPEDNLQVYVKNSTASADVTLQNINVIITELW